MVKCNVCNAFVLPIMPQPVGETTQVPVAVEVKYGTALTVAECYDIPSEDFMSQIRRRIEDRVKRYLERYLDSEFEREARGQPTSEPVGLLSGKR